MKRVLSFVLILSLCLPFLFSCASSLEALSETEGKGEIVYPEQSAVGYARIDISGRPPIAYYGGTATGVHDPLYLTCVALWDGEEIALVMTADLKKMMENVSNETLSIIEKKFDIPASHVILSCTHTHSAPDAGATTLGNREWVLQYYRKLPQVIEAALLDLAPVKQAFAGVSQMEEGVTFVRRYLMPDGTYRFNPSASQKPVEHESEADPEMRTIRFEREGAKDVLLVNFQTHYGGATSRYASKFSADFVDLFRSGSEENYDCHFAYFSGAGGNINFISVLKGERKYANYIDAAPAFAAACDRALAAEEKVSVGDVRAERSLYVADCQLRDPERVAQAREISKLGTSSKEGKALMKEYGFESDHEVSFTISFANLPPTQEVPLNAITFGDVGFAGAPYEMFHENGKQIRDGSPLKSTFVCTLSLGANGYVPSAIGYEHGSYETFNCRFAAGSGEKFADELVRLLTLCHGET